MEPSQESNIGPSDIVTEQTQDPKKVSRSTRAILFFVVTAVVISLVLIATQKWWSPHFPAFFSEGKTNSLFMKEGFDKQFMPEGQNTQRVLSTIIASTTRHLYSIDEVAGNVRCLFDRGQEVRTLPDSDASTFQVLGEFNTASHEDSYPAILAKDKNHVYLDCYILDGVDPATVSIQHEPDMLQFFKPNSTTTTVSPYIRDANGIYYFGERIPHANLTNRDTTGTKIVKRPLTTDAQNFLALGNHYAKDSRAIYYAGAVVENADHATFKVGYVNDGYFGDMYADSSDVRENYFRGKKESERACAETEKEMPLASELLKGKIVFIKDVTYSIGRSINGGNCLDILGSVDREISPPDRINQTTIDMVAEKARHTVVELPPRTQEFSVEQILEVSEDSMGSDGGPSRWLILSDKTGTQYKMPIIFFGENGAPDDDQVIAVLQFDSKEYPLTYESFEQYSKGTLKRVPGFKLSDEWVDVSTPFLSYDEAVAKVKKERGVDSIYQGGGKVWFKNPNSTHQRGCGFLSLYDINTRRYHDTDVLDCSTIDVSKTKPLYIEYCSEKWYSSCIFGDDTLRATDLNTKRLKEIFSINISAQNETLMRECHRNEQGGTSCTADISLTNNSMLRIGIYRTNEKRYSLDNYTNIKLRDEHVDLRKFR